MIFFLLDEVKTYPDWITGSFPIIRVVLMMLIAICAIAVTIIIMSMESNPEGGTNAISGQTESFYSKNQGSNKEGRLKLAVRICGITVAVLSVLFWVLWVIYPVAG